MKGTLTYKIVQRKKAFILMYNEDFWLSVLKGEKERNPVLFTNL